MNKTLFCIKKYMFIKPTAMLLAAVFCISGALSVYAEGNNETQITDPLKTPSVSNAEAKNRYTYDSDLNAAENICGMSHYGNITVIRDASPERFTNSVRILDAAGPASGWIASEGCSSVSVSDASDRYPWSAFDQNKCTSVTTEESGESWHFFERNLHADEELRTNVSETEAGKKIISGITANSCKEISFAVNMPDVGTAAYELRLQIFSSEIIIFDEICTVDSDGWNAVFADISESVKHLYENSAITKIRIGVRTKNENTLPFTFYFSGFSISDNKASIAYRYITDNYFVYGGALNYNIEDDVYHFNVNTSADAPFIETTSLKPSTFSKANAIRIAFIDNTDCSSVTCYYKIGNESEYSEMNSCTVEIENAVLPESNVISCIFPMTESDITNFRIVFKGCKTDDNIRILAVTPVSAATEANKKYGSIDSCKLSESTGEILIKGTVAGEISEKYSGQKIYIYALDPWQTGDNQTLSDLQPVTQVSVSSDFSVKFKISGYTAKKFTAAIRTGTGFIMIDTDKWITNIRQTGNTQLEERGAPEKGIITEVTEAQIIGSETSYITVDIGKLFSSRTTTVSHEFNDEIYYYNEAEFERLDSEIQSYRYSGIKLFLRIVLSAPNDAYIASNMLYTTAQRDITRYYAPNISNEVCVKLLSALCDMLAQRYSTDENGVISGFIIGKEINRAYENFYAGEKTLGEFASCCADLLRIIYNSTVSVNPELKICLSFGSDWYSDIGSDSVSRFGTRQLTDSVAAYINFGGDIDWSPAISLAKPNTSAADTAMYEDRSITSDKLGMVCSYMKQKKLLCGSIPRSILVLSDAEKNTESTSDDNDMHLAAEYIYNFYNISIPDCELVSSFIVTPNFDVIRHERMLKYIDTSNSLAETAEYARYFSSGAESWNDILGEEHTGMLLTSRSVTEAEILNYRPNIIGEASVWNIDGKENTDGWTAAESCISLETSNLLDKKNLLIAKLKRENNNASWRGISNTFSYGHDLSPFSYIYMNVQLAQMPESVDSAEMLVMIYSGKNYTSASTTVRAGEWNHVAVSLGAFDYSKNINKIKIFVRGSDGKTDIGNPTLIISDIQGLSSEYDSKYLSSHINREKAKYLLSENYENYDKIVVTLSAVIVLAAVAEILHIRLRIKHRQKKDSYNSDNTLYIKR